MEWNISRTSPRGNYYCVTLIRHNVNIVLHRTDFCKSLWTRNPSRRNKPCYRQLHQNSRVWYRLMLIQQKIFLLENWLRHSKWCLLKNKWLRSTKQDKVLTRYSLSWSWDHDIGLHRFVIRRSFDIISKSVPLP